MLRVIAALGLVMVAGCGSARLDYYGPPIKYVRTHNCHEIGVSDNSPSWDPLEGRIVTEKPLHIYACDGSEGTILIWYE